MLSDKAEAKEQLIDELEVSRVERKSREEISRNAEEIYRNLVNISPDVMYSGSPKDGAFLFLNQAFEKITGWSRAEWIGRPFMSIVHPDDLPLVMERFQQGLAGETPPPFEVRFLCKSGDYVVGEVIGTPRIVDGKVVEGYGFVRDITERKRAEKALRSSEERYRALFEQKLEGVVIIDEKMEILLANQAAAKMFGFDSVEEVRGANPFNFIPQEERERVLRALTKDMFEHNLRQVNEFRLINKAGEEIWISAVGTLIEYQGKPVGLVSFRDITGRKRMEEALRKTEREKAAILNGMSEVVVYQDMDMRILWANRAAGESVGLAPEQLVGHHCYEIWHQRSQPCAGCPVVRARETGQPEEVEMTTPDGRVWFAKGHPVRDANGGLVGMVELVLEITERKRAEEALKESEERYRSLVNNVKLGVFRSTPGRTGKFLEVNPAMGEITGYSRKELLKMNVSDLYVHPEEREAILEEVASVTGKVTKELRFREKDGTEIVISDTKVAVRDNTGKILYFDGIIQDITERKLAEEREKQLQQELNLSSRLAAIGELAAGVAHEINNPLTGILGFSQRLLRKSAEETQLRDLEIICNEAQRAAKVVENLLTFARRHEPKKEYLDINDILRKALELRAYELKISNIEVALDLAPSLPKTMADFHQIQEVFLNIILNAEQAMTEANGGGKLSIKTQPVRDYIKISFADDGPGIPDEHLDKLYDPFFTTRQERGGTGLGLSVCHGIVAEHGGRIYVKSKPGKGTTFFVDLPVTTEKL